MPITRQRLTYTIDVMISRLVSMRDVPCGDDFRYKYDATGIDQCQAIGPVTSWVRSGGRLARSRADGRNFIILVAILDIDDSVEVGSGAFKRAHGPAKRRRLATRHRSQMTTHGGSGDGVRERRQRIRPARPYLKHASKVPDCHAASE